MKECNHQNKVHSQYSIGTNVGSSTDWICKDCGEEGSTFTPFRDEYQEVKAKFDKSTITVDAAAEWTTGGNLTLEATNT